jgi:hypothetical protein
VLEVKAIQNPALLTRGGVFFHMKAKKDTHLLLTGRDALAQTLWLQHFANKPKPKRDT